MKLNWTPDDPIGKLLSQFVTWETLAEHEGVIRDGLRGCDLHPLQMDFILGRNRELMQAGMPHGQALWKACQEVGPPAGKADLFWDDKLEVLIRTEYGGTLPL